MKQYLSKTVSNKAVVTGKYGRWTQITCMDLPKSHHNRIVNIITHLPVGTKGKVLYKSSFNCGLLTFESA